MSQEKLFSDFSGGMNALGQVDKLDPKECLLAENVRLDETGNILSGGAFTHQNNVSYGASVHSLYWNPSLGAVAGVDGSIYSGPTLGGMTLATSGVNPNQQKMAFASAPNRVYFDLGASGYWTDMTNLLTVDWPPPSASTAVATGPNTATYFFTNGVTGTATNFGFSLGTTQPMQGLQITVSGTSTFTIVGTATYSQGQGSGGGGSNTNAVTTGTVYGQVIAHLLVNGIAVGTGAGQQIPYTYLVTGTNTQVFLQKSQYIISNANQLLGVPTLTPQQVNATNFGVVFTAGLIPDTHTQGGQTTVGTPATVTAYQKATGFVAGTGGAGTLTGTYSWKVTFVAANGEESDASIDSTLCTFVGQQGTITAIPTGDARTTSRNIYRIGYAASTPLTLHYLVGSIPDNTTTTFSDNLSDLAAITAGTILAGDVPGDSPNTRFLNGPGNGNGRYPVYHYDRVFWVNPNQPNEIFWSKPLDGFAYPVVNFIDVGDSKPISRLISIFGELIIIKTDSIWRLTGTDESSFDLTQTPSSVGTDIPFSVVALPDKVLFANRWGLWVFNGYTSQPLTTKLDLWFKQNDRTGVSLFGVNGFHPIEVVSAGVTSRFDACGNSEKFYLAYAEAGQQQNNALLVFDVKHGNLTKREPGAPLPLSLAIDPVTGFVYMGDASGFVSLLDDWNGANGGGAALNFDFQHGYQDLQRGSNKRFPAIEFFLNTNGIPLTPTIYYDNGANFETLAPITTTSLRRVVRTLQAPNSRKAQSISWRMNGSLSLVNVAGTPQIQIVHVKIYYDIYSARARTGQ